MYELLESDTLLVRQREINLIDRDIA